MPAVDGQMFVASVRAMRKAQRAWFRAVAEGRGALADSIRREAKRHEKVVDATLAGLKRENT